jgi:hypothetical protein
MFSRRHAPTLDTSLFDPDHDLDLVAMFNNARTETELHAAAGVSRSRMRARRAALGGSRWNRRASSSNDSR